MSRDSIWRSKRILIFLITFLIIAVITIFRTNTSIVLLCMTQEQHDHNSTNTMLNKDFHQIRIQQGNILSSFFYGYILFQIASAYLSNRYGPKIVICVCLFVSSAVTLVTPVMIRGSSAYVFMMLRFLVGATLGFLMPACMQLWGAWSPLSERSKLIGFSLLGMEVGVILSLSFSGFICKVPWLGGWPLIYYIHGCLGMLVCLLFACFCYNCPAEHPTIADSEKSYIIGDIPRGSQSEQQKAATPWRSILTSVPFLSVVLAHVSNNCGYYNMVSCIPLFVFDVFSVDIKQNGMISSLPFMCAVVLSVFASPLADVMRNSGYLSITNIRKIFQIVGLLLPATFMFAITYVGKDMAVVLLVFGVGALGLSRAGIFCNLVDIAPRYSGILIGLSNTAATVPGMIAPSLTGYLTQNGEIEEWRNVFLITAGIFTLGGVVFVIFADGEVQEWACLPVTTEIEGQPQQITNKNIDISSVDNVHISECQTKL